MFCRGDSEHDKHWFRSITQCFPDKIKTSSKVLDNTHWYCCASKSTKDDDINVDYVSSQKQNTLPINSTTIRIS